VRLALFLGGQRTRDAVTVFEKHREHGGGAAAVVWNGASPAARAEAGLSEHTPKAGHL
jgi:hypothetical protein